MALGFGTGSTIAFATSQFVATLLESSPVLTRGKHRTTHMGTTAHETHSVKTLLDTTVRCRIQWDPTKMFGGGSPTLQLPFNKAPEVVTITFGGQAVRLVGTAFVEQVEPAVVVEEWMEATIQLQFTNTNDVPPVPPVWEAVPP